MSSNTENTGSYGDPVSFVDLQINGLAGIDFNAEQLSEQAWRVACEALSKDGTRYFLPTLITDSVEALEQKLKRLGPWIDSPSLAGYAQPLGIHLEGPFLSAEPGFIGAHPGEFARDVDLELMKRLQDLGHGKIRMVTLAPERDSGARCIRWLADQGIVVAAGHTDASLDQLKRAVDQGLTLFTHLGNACPANLPRHDNIIQRALALRNFLRYTLIADGYHVPYWLLNSWIEILGEDRVAIISDAISAAGLPAGMYRLGSRNVHVGQDGVPRSEDGTHFVGSGMTLGRMAQTTVQHCPWSSEVRAKLFRDNAMRWIGLTKDLIR